LLSGGTYTVSGTGLTNISGLSISVAAAGIYDVEAFIAYTQSAANAVGFGVTFPGMTNATGTFQGNVSVGPVAVSSFSIFQYGSFDEAGSGSIIYSVSATTNTRQVRMRALFVVSSSGGTIQMQGRVSAVAAQMFIIRGSYIRAFKIG